MSQHGVTDPLTEKHSAGHESSADGAISHRSQEKTDVSDLADAVDPHGNGIDIDHGDSAPNRFEVAVAEPCFLVVHVDVVAHMVIIAPQASAAGDC